MGKKHRSRRRRHGISIPEAIIAMQAGRWGNHFSYDQGRRSRRDREFDRAELQLMILQLVDEEPRRGHEIVAAIAELSDGRREPGPEIIYPTLTFLEDSGLIEAKKAKTGGKVYSITDAGREELEEQGDEGEPLIGEILDEDTKEARAAIKAAMRNLAGVLAQRMMAKGIDEKLLDEVAAIVDDAAERIGKL